MKKTPFRIIPMHEIKELIPSALVPLGNDFILGEIGHFISTQTQPSRLDAISLILITEGSLRIQLDYSVYNCSAGDLLTIGNEHLLQLSESSEDFRALLILVSEEIMQRMEFTASTFHYIQLKNHPYMALTEDEQSSLTAYFELMKQKIVDTRIVARKETLSHLFAALMYDMGSAFLRNIQTEVTGLSRKDLILEQFLNLLIGHFRTEHNVTFYAERMFITPQHLTAVLKELSGKTTSQWIDTYLLFEARMLLKQGTLSIQEVAAELNFPDQSTFGKFFKKHMGISPLQYKKI